MKVFTKEQVLKVAKLVNLNLNQEEILKFETLLPTTLETIEVLNEVDTSEVKPTSHVTGTENRYQQEGICETLTPEEALKNAKSSKNNLFETEGVFADR